MPVMHTTIKPNIIDESNINIRVRKRNNSYYYEYSRFIILFPTCSTSKCRA